MATPDMEVIKEIPGYKVILKAVLKSQIQQLVEQLSAHTGEESIILTASVADGTLSHISSGSGKSFLEDHEEVKSQFLGFCLRWHQKKQQEEKEEAERKAVERVAIPVGISKRAPRPMPAQYPGVPGYSLCSPGSRHQPYHVHRPFRATLGANFHRNLQPAMKSPIKMNEQMIKIEVDNENEISDQNDIKVSSQSAHTSSQPSSPSQTPTSLSSHLKDESSVKDDDSQSSTSTIPNEQPHDGLSLDSNLSNLFSGAPVSSSVPQTPCASGEIDDNVSVKVEAISEADLELEITGVEPGRQMVLNDNWSPSVSMGMNFDPSMTLNFDVSHGVRPQADMLTAHPGNRYSFDCKLCGKTFSFKTNLRRHMLIHTGERPHECELCGRRFSRKDVLKEHVMVMHCRRC